MFNPIRRTLSVLLFAFIVFFDVLLLWRLRCFYTLITVRTVPDAFCIRVCLSVSRWICASHWKICKHHISKKWSEFYPILVTDVFGLIDVLTRFWAQKAKGQGHSRW